MRNFIVDAGGSAGSAIKVHPGSTNVLIENGEVTNSIAALVTGTSFTARRLNLHHGGQDGFNPYDNVVIENNWVHHLGMQDGAHADGVQLGGGSNFVIRNNYFDMPINQSGFRSNAAIFIRAWKGPIRNVTVDGNWMNGGNYTVYVMDDSGNVKVTNNWFGRDFRYGPKRVNATGTVTWSNNRFWDNNALIP